MKTPGLWKGKAAQGVMPAMGVKLEIEEIERSETGENSQTPGCLMYVGHFRVVEPESYKGRRLMEWFPIGTKDDKRAKRDETWNRPEQGPGRLIRLMEKAGVPNSDDDEEWMEAAVGATVFAHVQTRTDENGEKRNRMGMYYAEKDEEFVGVGEELEAPRSGGARGGRKAKPARREDDDESPRARKAKRQEDDEEPKKRGDDDDEEGEDEEDEPRSARRGKNGEKRAAKRRGGDDDDEDED